MTLYQYILSCGHKKLTPDRRELGVTVRCNSCAARGWSDQRQVESASELRRIGDEEDTRG